ncbi:hypothetical protein ACIRQO_36460 [Streptomyces anulatus]|uniref:hypothetical protein n=1 Tax=Streptomyces anulatus TaxID=1892 RepID=UPI0022554ADF|nr:hypothetical protein [Streptomyces anulatus]MCX4523938.1 hypothetical protein [Streptomyces anulatus]WSU78953.1 hypothetical protein OG499_38980 [Streptomyces anulatus]
MKTAAELAKEQRERVIDELGAPEIPIPTPWPALTEIADLLYWHKVGIVAQRGTREAKVGRDVAVHAAQAGVPTLLYTGYPPDSQHEWLAVDETPRPTVDQVNMRAKQPINGKQPRFVVIERYERLALPPARPASVEADDCWDDADPETALSWGDRLVDTVRHIRVKMPMLLTAVMDVEPDLSRRMCTYLHRDHPAEVMTDICVPTIVVHRTGPRTVKASMDVSSETYVGPQDLDLLWEPLSLRERNGN